MIITPQSSLCYDILAIRLDNGTLDISWVVDTDSLKSLLEENQINKILDFHTNIDFDIYIDNVDTFDSINLKTFTFSQLEQTYRGNMVYSAIVPFNKDKFEETNYFVKVRLKTDPKDYVVNIEGLNSIVDITFEDIWSDNHNFVIRKDYRKDLVEIMYKTVADFNAYNKEAKSANMYYIFQAVADVLNTQFNYIENEKERLMINKSLPDMLKDTFGELLKFSNVDGLTMEEYRRIIRNLMIGYQNGGAWNYIKEVLKYLIGYTPDLITLQNFYPWILRKATIIGYDINNDPIYDWTRPDPINFEDRNYYNPESNYYIFKEFFTEARNKNEVMLINSYEKLFTFIVRSTNFFNLNIDEDKIKNILDLLKSAYTKYSLNIDDYINPNAL